ncbi:zf-HC2 domain-containing protein [Streptacidiphilus sp. PB12-B1b]|uniref:anti-sigma factor family protein n=1 Tax=Streptacidiphilus sp. PB12-B1b TaxID=2705012 RepID=UPI0015FADBEA|nr:zf-HC2 domain-containing protein [Streptacidiphilus sp. PB12-B1b]QMU75194.1 zf-HC2 domain-containing protein [Streptacidiphilus sp. PB12-B1b]
MTERPRRARQPEVVVELRVTRTAPGVPAADQHLGERMAAFVDGELDHDARERVLSHLATCAACLARAEEERRLKSRLQAAAAPGPSGPLLSRLMAISMESDEDRGAPPSGGGGGQIVRGVFGGNSLGSGGAVFGSGLFGRGALGAEHPVPGVDPRAERSMPFRGGPRPIAARMDAMDDPMRRPDRPAEPVRSATAGSLARGRRFAFAAAGAFSVAAVALGSAVTGVTASGTPVEEPYGNVAPVADSSTAGGGQFPDFGSRTNSRMVAAPLNAGSAADLANALDAQHGAASPTATPSPSSPTLPLVGGRTR